VWVSGSCCNGAAALFRLDAESFRPGNADPIAALLGTRAAIVATYGTRLLVRAVPATRSLYCVNAATGDVAEKWTVARGGVTLNPRGLVFTSRAGIGRLSARDCLAG
jgi:outer membrane protein assembly factor BamB